MGVMNILHEEDRHRFSVATESGPAVVEYELSGDTVNFTHTFVPAEQRGRGLAEALVKQALDWAEARQLRIEASCWYVAKYMDARRPHLRTSK